MTLPEPLSCVVCGQRIAATSEDWTVFAVTSGNVVEAHTRCVDNLHHIAADVLDRRARLAALDWAVHGGS